MPFPESDREIYQNNPLAEVICQLRFPTILRIDTQSPVDFQERIRADYPTYRQVSALPPNLPPEMAAAIQLGGSGSIRGGHEFVTADGIWSITLTSNFLALKTTKYLRWEEFHVRLSPLLAALTDIYQPSFFERIGLRYVDIIQRSRLDLSEKSWAELIEPHLAGEFSAPIVADRIDYALREVSIQLAEGAARVVIRHGTVMAEPTNEQCFLIDSDFFNEQRTEIGHAPTHLDRFHRKAGNLFRWCIRPTLRNALGPRPSEQRG